MFINHQSTYFLLSKVFVHLTYALSIVFILLGSDLIYSFTNEFFRFFIAEKEILKLLLGALIVSFFKKKWRFIFFGTLLLFSFFQYAHFQFYGRNIDAIEFTLLFNNIEEVAETALYDVKIFISPLLIVLSVFLLFYLIEKFLAGKRLVHFNWAMPIGGLLLIIIFAKVFYVVNIKIESLTHNESKLIYSTTNRHSARNYYVSANYALTNYLSKIIYKDNVNVKKIPAGKISIIKKPRNRTIVLVIGESLRADRFFDKNLTQKISTSIDNKAALAKTIYSGGTMTKTSVSTLINVVPGPGYYQHIIDESSCLFKLAKKNGFETAFISNQPPKKLDIIQNLVCPQYIDNYADKADVNGATGHDEDILKHLKQKKWTAENNFIVIQYRGSHSPYSKQFPLNNKDESLSDYDNSVKYTDSVIYDLLSYFKQNRQDVSWFFTSDHGELLGEQGKNGHGFMEPQVYRVPLLAWSNYDSALENNLEKITSHYELARYIAKQLGYNVDHNLKHINILNSDLDGFSGHAEVIDGKVNFKRQR